MCALAKQGSSRNRRGWLQRSTGNLVWH